MALLFLSSRKQKRSRTSPGIERTKPWRFLPRPRRCRQIQTPLPLAQLLEKLQPNLTSSHLLYAMNRISRLPCASFIFKIQQRITQPPNRNLHGVALRVYEQSDVEDYTPSQSNTRIDAMALSSWKNQ